MAIRIYEQNGMVRVDDGSGNFMYSTSKGNGCTIVMSSPNTLTIRTPLNVHTEAITDIKDASGAALSGTVNGTIQALESILGRVPTGVVTSSISANGGSVQNLLNGLGGVGIRVSGTWAGTLQFEASVDGVNFDPIPASVLGGGARGTTTTGNGTFVASGAALVAIRVIATSWTSGSAMITILATDDVRGVVTDVAASASAVAITPADTGSIPATRAIYIGAGGNIVALINGQAITFKNVMSGTILPVSATRVNLTNTTATDLIALY